MTICSLTMKCCEFVQEKVEIFVHSQNTINFGPELTFFSLHDILAAITTDSNGNIPSTLINNHGIITHTSRYLINEHKQIRFNQCFHQA